MGTYRPGKQARQEYFRQLDRDLDAAEPKVYVIQERRALREMARDLGVEFLLGDAKEEARGGLSQGMTLEDIAKKHKVSLDRIKTQFEIGRKVEREHTESQKKADKIARDHLVEIWDYYTRLKKVEKSSDPELVILIEKAGRAPIAGHIETSTPHASDAPHASGEERWPHKYTRRYKGRDGKWVYVYAEDTAKQHGFHPGFPKEREKMQEPPPIGQKRARVMREVEERAAQKRADEPKKAYGDWREAVKEMLKVPGVTQDVMREAMTKVGMKGFEDAVKETQKKFKGIDHPQDIGLMVEHTARTIVGRAGHEDAELTKTEPSKFAKRPGGFVASDVNMRHAWQLTAKEYEDRRQHDHALMGTDYKSVITAAMKRGEYVPNNVLTQDVEGTDLEKWLPDAAEHYLKEQKPEPKFTQETLTYLEKFERLSEGLPTKFDAWVDSKAKAEGDSYLLRQKASNYNIDAYDVTDAGIYAHMLQSKDQTVMYHQYSQDVRHGRELLGLLHEHGIDAEYTVIRRASAVFWDPAWGPVDKEMTTRTLDSKNEKGDNHQIAYSSDYILAFRPKDQKQAEGLVELLKDYANRGDSGKPHQAIHGSWKVPDVRSTKAVDKYEELFLNLKEVGGQDLTILTRHDWIRSGKEAAPGDPSEVEQGTDVQGDYDPEFRREKLFVDGELAGYVKSFEECAEILVGEIVIAKSF